MGVIAIRLAMLVLVGWSLTLLPRQTRDSESACFRLPAARLEAQSLVKTPGLHVADAAFEDMRLHD